DKKRNMSHINCDLLEKLCLLTVVAANFVDATDIHLSSTIDDVGQGPIGVIRFRIQGMLKTIVTFEHDQVQGIIEKWMSLSQCDLHQKLLPQDGRIQYNLSEILTSLPNKKIDFLISFTPSYYGIALTARLLNVNIMLDRMNIENFGFDPQNVKRIKQAINLSYGLILVSSPPSHGKTTLMLSLLKEIAGPSMKIASIENPIEVVIPWATQTQINKTHGLDYVNGLRSIMRTDPDVIMVSEFDDSDKLVEMGIDIANSGHLLIGTFQCQCVLDSLEKILALFSSKRGIIAEGIKMIISQRLIRKLCPHCKQKYRPTKTQIDQLTEHGPIPAKLIESTPFYRPKGCPKCVDGYQGRFALEEVLTVTSKVKDAILKDKHFDNLILKKLDPCFKTFLIRGSENAAQGKTSLDELIRCLNL
ncbi:MAG: ATPase, T2SS/T4P/T4SS family, partial [Bdellovibrionota bacterium]